MDVCECVNIKSVKLNRHLLRKSKCRLLRVLGLETTSTVNLREYVMSIIETYRTNYKHTKVYEITTEPTQMRVQ